MKYNKIILLLLLVLCKRVKEPKGFKDIEIFLEGKRVDNATVYIMGTDFLTVSKSGRANIPNLDLPVFVFWKGFMALSKSTKIELKSPKNLCFILPQQGKEYLVGVLYLPISKIAEGFFCLEMPEPEGFAEGVSVFAYDGQELLLARPEHFSNFKEEGGVSLRDLPSPNGVWVRNVPEGFNPVFLNIPLKEEIKTVDVQIDVVGESNDDYVEAKYIIWSPAPITGLIEGYSSRIKASVPTLKDEQVFISVGKAGYSEVITVENKNVIVLHPVKIFDIYFQPESIFPPTGYVTFDNNSKVFVDTTTALKIEVPWREFIVDVDFPGFISYSYIIDGEMKFYSKLKLCKTFSCFYSFFKDIFYEEETIKWKNLIYLSDGAAKFGLKTDDFKIFSCVGYTRAQIDRFFSNIYERIDIFGDVKDCEEYFTENIKNFNDENLASLLGKDRKGFIEYTGRTEIMLGTALWFFQHKTATNFNFEVNPQNIESVQELGALDFSREKDSKPLDKVILGFKILEYAGLSSIIEKDFISFGTAISFMGPHFGFLGMGTISGPLSYVSINLKKFLLEGDISVILPEVENKKFLIEMEVSEGTQVSSPYVTVGDTDHFGGRIKSDGIEPAMNNYLIYIFPNSKFFEFFSINICDMLNVFPDNCKTTIIKERYSSCPNPNVNNQQIFSDTLSLLQCILRRSK